MRVLLWATLILTIPSFVLLYGWSELSRVQQSGFDVYAKVDTRVDGRQNTHEVRRGELTQIRQSVSQAAFMRLIGVMQQFQNLDFARWQDLLGNQLNERYLVERAADNVMLRHIARSMGLVVPQAEIERRIAEIIGGASEADFQAWLRREGITTTEFIASLEDDLLTREARQIQRHVVKASLYELWWEYLLGNEEVDVTYVDIQLPEIMATIEPTDEELEAYFEANRADFTLPERVQLKYVMLDQEAIAARIAESLTTAELEAFYEEVKATDFLMPREVEGRHLAIHFGEGLRTREEALALAAEAKSLLDLGVETFADMANRLSDDPTNIDKDTLLPLGGALSQSINANSFQFGPSYRDAVLALEGGISEPFVSTYQPGRRGEVEAVFLFEVEEIIAESHRPFATVESLLRRRLSRQRAPEEVQKVLRDWQAAAADSFSIDEVADMLEVEVLTSSWISRLRPGFVQGIGDLTTLTPMINRVYEEGGISPVMPLNSLQQGRATAQADRYIIFEVDRLDPSRVPASLDEVNRDRVVQDYRRSVALERATQRAEELRAAIVAERQTLLAMPAAAEDGTPTPREALTPAEMRAIFETVTQQNDLVSRSESFRRSALPGLFQTVKDFGRRSLGFEQGDLRLERSLVGDATNALLLVQVNELKRPSIADLAAEFPTVEQGYLLNKADALLAESLVDLRREGNLQVTPGQALR